MEQSVEVRVLSAAQKDVTLFHMWFFALFFLFTAPALAQDTTPNSTPQETPTTIPSPTSVPNFFEQYKKDYLFQYDIYQQSYLKYVDKKRVWTKYGTITTQKEKFDASIEAINARNKTFKAYLLALRTLLDDYESINPTATEKHQIEISKWESWFSEQITVVSAINNEKDLTRWVEEFKEKYITIQQTIYSSLVQHEVNLRQSTLDKIQALGLNIKNNPQIQTESQQWVSTLAVKSDLVSTSLNNALLLTQKNQSQNKFNNFYPNSKQELTQANNYLIEITTDLKLIVNKFFRP